MQRHASAVVLTLVVLSNTGHAATLWSPDFRARPQAQSVDLNTICGIVRRSADTYHLPEPFLARLLWRQSGFYSQTVDSEGRAGIARITPALARQTNISNRFDPDQSIPAVASYLSDLRGRYGNLGLAAAAFGVGENNFVKWRAEGSRKIPTNLDNFLFEVTGKDARSFLDKNVSYDAAPLINGMSFEQGCRSLPIVTASAQEKINRDRPWSAVVAGNWCRAAVVQQWNTLSKLHPRETERLNPTIQKWKTPLGAAGIYAAKVYVSSRGEAGRICGQLHNVGGACLIVRN